MNNKNKLLDCRLFKNTGATDIGEFLKCLNARTKEYKKGSFIVIEGDDVFDIGVVLSGKALAFMTDASGKDTVINVLQEMSIFGDVLAANRGRKSPVTIVATEDSEVLYIPFENIIHRCEKGCVRHEILIKNLVDGISEKYFVLQERLRCIVCTSMREKIMTLLLSYKESIVSLPFDREGMAKYLNTDRSALSRELSKMKKEGIIDYYKNTFKILKR